jgi:ferredoxin
LESRNGTSVNGEKIGKEKHLLKVDDLIDLSLKKPLQCVFKLEKAVKSPETIAAEKKAKDVVVVDPNLPDFDYIVGRVSVNLFKEKLPSNNYDYYLCGSAPFMDSITTGLKEWDVPSGKVHFESFGPGSPTKKVKAVKLENELTVNFSTSDKVLGWDGSHDSILELAENEDIDLGPVCRSGSCGSCKVKVLEGHIEYSSEPSATLEDGEAVTCVGTPSENLVIANIE